MNIGGLQKFSLSDYPGLPAAVIFCQGCNFRCPFCHNGELLPLKSRTPGVSRHSVLAYLEKRRKQLQGVVISGGEPTLQRDLPEFLEQIRVMGYRIKLDTNGSRPHVVEQLLRDNLLDYIAMDIKAPFPLYANLAGVDADIMAVQATIDLIVQSSVEFLFRTTWVKSLLTRQDIETIKAGLPVTASHIVQSFNANTSLDGALCQ